MRFCGCVLAWRALTVSSSQQQCSYSLQAQAVGLERWTCKGDECRTCHRLYLWVAAVRLRFLCVEWVHLAFHEHACQDQVLQTLHTAGQHG